MKKMMLVFVMALVAMSSLFAKDNDLENRAEVVLDMQGNTAIYILDNAMCVYSDQSNNNFLFWYSEVSDNFYVTDQDYGVQVFFSIKDGYAFGTIKYLESGEELALLGKVIFNIQ